MKIEILENFKHGREQFTKDEMRVVSTEDGTLFCQCGWARDVEGVVPTGDRDKAHGRVLDVQSIKQIHKTVIVG